MIIVRNKYIRQLIENRHNGLVKVITGIRRCGKSFLLFNLFKQQLQKEGVDNDHIIEMAFDDFGNRKYRNPDKFYQYIKSLIKDENMYYILLDEVQMMNEFEDVLNGLLHIPNADVYVTGSNAKFLSKDIITEFRGRGYQIHISPLSFSEFMSVYQGSKEEGWIEYLQYGGLPPVVLQPTAEGKIKLLKDLWKETYLIDILNRNRIKNNAELEELLCMLASGIGGLVNPQKLSNTFKTNKNITIAPATLKNYIDYCSDAFLIEEANRYDVKGRKYIGTPMKFYFSDLGLRNALLNFRQIEKTHLMENAIYCELRRQGFNVDVGVVVFNGKDENGVSFRKQLEVDFVCNKGSRRYYIQSALSLPTPEKMDQETNSLRRIDDGFEKIVIVGEHFVSNHDNNGILFMSIYEFMSKELS
ncbi:ATP-binding protein [Prevotella copri]|jgi:predicted AAA+ superfamily ATPase|uniref:ATP-binding protein n=1 Tax=Segatella copri TaxID=165179 RepID=A0AAP3FAB2_9BACT|nr:ATP-binding protein [Segatella copri]MCW4128619.1 ATP-binding protein [Segatella copri]MCW4414884.1 ATP-binding protein [Segatella copri]MCW4421885.1 ATP-binding protein [Segatella copri]